MNRFSSAQSVNKFHIAAIFCLQFCFQSMAISAETTLQPTLPSPIVWLESEANKLLNEIDLKRPQFEKNEKVLEDFLYQKALPFWDTRRMARGLGGNLYRTAPSKLKNDLENEWKFTLVRYFIKAFPYYDGQRLSLNKEMKCPAKNRCWLRTTVEIAGKSGVDLDFYVRWNSHAFKPGRWQVIDLRVAGVSLLKHKRGETREVLHKQGIKGLIKQLRIKNSSLIIAAAVPGA